MTENHSCGAGCTHFGGELWQSPTIIYPSDILKIPKDAMHNLAAAVDYTSPENKANKADIAVAANFIFSTMPKEDAGKTVKALATALKSDRALVNALADPSLVGELNYDLANFFVANRKMEKKTFWQTFWDGFNNFNPFRTVNDWWRGLRGQKPEAESSERETIAQKGEKDLRRTMSFYVRQLLKNPEMLSDNEHGGVRTELLTYIMPKLVEKLFDEKFIEGLDFATRNNLERLKDQIVPLLVNAMPEAAVKSMSQPDFFDLKITGHDAGHMEVEKKIYKADYGEAIGQEIKIKAAEENAAAGSAKKPDIKVQGQEFFADHAHWHLGDTEHRINGEKRNLKGELHIVHKNSGGKALVMGAYIEVDDKIAANPLVDAILNGSDSASHSYLDFIGKDKWAAGKYHTYHGTLTTEPYSGGVTFYLLNSDTVKMTSQQYEQLKAHIKMQEKDNSRADQAYGDRAIVEATAKLEPDQKAI